MADVRFAEFLDLDLTDLRKIRPGCPDFGPSARRDAANEAFVISP
jgi:hypothetical protein